MAAQDLLPNLFRTEFRKITSVICKLYGFEHIETAEDITCETFLAAAESWPYNGIPPNPTAWLYAVAKNKAKNLLSRQKLFAEKISPHITDTVSLSETATEWLEKDITDSQLQMMFAVCDPIIPQEAQVCLALRILCGLGIDEIANAFLSNKENINKRLYRAKEKLREENVKLEFPSANEIEKRLDRVLLCLYLLYNEGYYSESDNNILREDLCFEAMHLTKMLLDNGPTNLPKVNALYALMCFHSSRFAARKNGKGEIILYDDQDESLWDRQLIAQGILHLKQASVGNTFNKYHIEAGIAYWYTIKKDSAEKWESILFLHNQLLQLNYSAIAALNRTYAFAKVHGTKKAIAEALKLQLKNNPYYFTLLGELYKNVDPELAKENLNKALAIARTAADRQVIAKKLDILSSNNLS